MYSINELLTYSHGHWKKNFDMYQTIDVLLTEYPSHCYVTVTDDDSGSIEQYRLDRITDIDQHRSISLNAFITNTTTLGVKESKVMTLKTKRRMIVQQLWEQSLIDSIGLLRETTDEIDPSIESDLVLTPSEKIPNINLFKRNAILVVNGKICPPPNRIEDKFYFMGMGASIMQQQEKHIQIINFAEMGGFDLIPCATVECDVVMHDGVGIVYISYKFEDNPTQQYPIIVFGGRLFINSKQLKFIDGKFVLIFNYNQLKASLGREELTADIVYAIATSPSSFFLLFDSTEVGSGITHLHPTNIEGFSTYPTVPKGIMLMADGSIGDYVISNSTEEGVIIKHDANVTTTKQHTTAISEYDGVIDNRNEINPMSVKPSPVRILDIYLPGVL